MPSSTLTNKRKKRSSISTCEDIDRNAGVIQDADSMRKYPSKRERVSMRDLPMLSKEKSSDTLKQTQYYSLMGNVFFLYNMSG
jgi:hypothetical protein